MRRFKEQWKKLVSGLYVPPLLKFAPWYYGNRGPCCTCEEEAICDEESCVDAFSGLEATVDLDVGGWTNLNCAGAGEFDCTDVAGEYVLPYTTILRWEDEYLDYCTGLYKLNVAAGFACIDRVGWYAHARVILFYGPTSAPWSETQWRYTLGISASECPVVQLYTLSHYADSSSASQPCWDSLPASIMVDFS